MIGVRGVAPLKSIRGTAAEREDDRADQRDAHHLSGLPAGEGWAERVLGEVWMPLGVETSD